MATTLRDSLLPIVDIIRSIPGQLGLRLFTVAVITRTWSGTRVGLGTSTDVVTGIKVDTGLFPTKVRQLTEKDVVASGGLYSSQDFEVGPFTPPYTGSTADGDAIAVFDPPVSGTPTEVFFRLTGPGFPATGAYFAKIGQDVSKSFRYTFVIRKLATHP